MSETKVRCPHCGELFEQSAIEDHIRESHGDRR